MRVLGMISGTSHDGIDAAVVEFVERDGALHGSVVFTDSTPYSPELREQLRSALPPAQTTFSQMCELDTLIGQAFADVAMQAIASSGDIDLICSHGQTVYHWVDGAHALGTLQIGQPAWIAERTGVPVVSDVRMRDITVGGHGAPLVSFLDALLLAAFDGTSAALNMGGISNMTVTRPDDEVSAYDIGPANALIDWVVAESGLNDLGYDADGQIAAIGTVESSLLEVLLADPYYALPAPKSTGKEHFHGTYIQEAVAKAGVTVSDTDLIATLTDLTVQTVARDVRAAGVGHLVVSGGGCRNPVILHGLRQALPGVEVLLSDKVGAPADDKEAIAFALIGWCTWHGLAATVPTATGASAPSILGTITPGAQPLQLPTPHLTDANVVLHRISPSARLGRTLALDEGAAREAVQKVAEPLGMSVEGAAEAILDIVNENMHAALRVVSVERGHDPRGFGLIAFGGAGPLHACALARLIQTKPVVIPPTPGVMSAFGFLSSDTKNEFPEIYLQLAEETSATDLKERLESLRAQAEEWLVGEGVDGSERGYELYVDCRYYLQNIQIPCQVTLEELDGSDCTFLRERFEREHKGRYNFELPDSPLEMATLRVVGRGKIKGVSLKPSENGSGEDASGAIEHHEQVYFGGEWRETPTYAREGLRPGNVVTGPAIVAQADTTTVIEPGHRASVDRFGNILIEISEEA